MRGYRLCGSGAALGFLAEGEQIIAARTVCLRMNHTPAMRTSSGSMTYCRWSGVSYTGRFRPLVNGTQATTVFTRDGPFR